MHDGAALGDKATGLLAPSMALALRALADVRFGILPSQSGLCPNDEQACPRHPLPALVRRRKPC